MNKRTFIHVLLIASLCFGQLIANVHMAGHFHNNHATRFASFAPNSVTPHVHPHLTEHVDDHAVEHLFTKYRSYVDHAGKAKNADSHNNADCAIYHAYLGQSGCPSAFSSGIAASTRGITSTPVVSAPIAAAALRNRPIRGPPAHS